jgi:predicted HTH transcriptional regulator
MVIVSLIYKGKLAQTYRQIEVFKGALHPKKISPANPNKEKTLNDYLKEEESYYLEFKSSMLWDSGRSECSQNGYLELEIIRTIAAFINSDGGTLLVGIDPNKKIVGIEQDFQCISGKNSTWDEWQQYLQGKIKKYIKHVYFGDIRVTRLLKGLKTIALIRVEKGYKPVNVRYIKDGIEKYEFYVRGFNGNELLNPNESFEYIQQHWSH